MISDNQSSQSQSCQHFGILRVKHQKASLNGRPIAYTEGGRAQFSPNTSHVIRKRTVNGTLAMGHQADPVHYYKFHILQANSQYTIINIILGLGKTTNSQDRFPLSFNIFIAFKYTIHIKTPVLTGSRDAGV
jgi:hypothetical protein